MPTGLFVTHPLTGEKIEVWVGNYVLMGYGEGAVMGVPAHDERDFAFAKKYGLPIKQVIAVDGETFSTDAWQPWYADKKRGRCVNSGKYDGLDLPAGGRRHRRRPRGEGPGRKADARAACATGASRASATGARRSRSSTAPPAATCRCPTSDLPVVLPEDCVPDGTGNPLAKRADFVERHVPEVRRAGEARDRHDGHLRRLVLVLHALRLPRRSRRWSTSASTTGCRWTSTSAASSTRSCTCSTRASGPR